MDSKERLENVKRRIKKLLALSKSPNEHEAIAALAKARALMDEHNLTEGECQYTWHSVKATKRLSKWRAFLSNAVAWLNYCESIRTPSAGEIVFFGEDLDAYLAKEMYCYLSKTIDRMVKQNIKKKTTLKYREKYRIGIAWKIHKRIYEQGGAVSWAPQRENKLLAIKNAVESVFSVTRTEIKLTGSRGAAFLRGVKDGDGVSLNRQATGHGDRFIGSGDI